MAAASKRKTVFLSYHWENLGQAHVVRDGLEKFGISVWWDADIPIGGDIQEYLTDQITSAKCVVVLWSEASVKSAWVSAEAELAVQRKTYLRVLLEQVEVPRKFDRFQAAMLQDWTGDPGDPPFQRLVAGIRRMIETAPAPADETRSFNASQRNVQLRAEELFQSNLRSETLIEYVELDGTLFHERLSWNVTPGVNVLLGRNGYGKTLLLRSLLALLQYDDQIALQTINKDGATISILRNGQEDSIRFSDLFFDDSVGKLPVLAIPDTRFINRSVTTLGAVADEAIGSGDRADLARMGALHFLAERPYEGMIQSFLYGLCLDYFEDGLSFRGEQFVLVRDVVLELTDQVFDFDRVAREGRDRFTLYVRTEGNEDNPLPIQKCSQGTSSVIAMFGLIYDYLKSLRQDSVTDVRQRRGIVVIDEVDAHLHPVWQQKIVTLLRQQFPNVQFIITAHNPIAVAGCLEDEVSVLRKSTNRGFSLFQFPNDFIGWQTEEIYRKVFEIETPDASFTLLDAMRPFKGKLQEEAAALASQPNRSSEQERTLQALEEKVLYIDNVEQARATRLSQEELERENKTLRDRLRSWNSVQATAAEAQMHLDQLRLDLEDERRASRKRLVEAGLAVAIVTAAATLAATVLVARFYGFGILYRLT